MYQLEYVSGRFSTSDLCAVCNVSEALLKSCSIAGMYPKYPNVGRTFPCSICKLDGKLGLSVQRSDVEQITQGQSIHTRRLPVPPARSTSLLRCISLQVDLARSHDQQSQHRDEMARWKKAPVGFLFALGDVVSAILVSALQRPAAA